MNITYTGKFYKGLTREMKSPTRSVKLTYAIGETYLVEDFDTSDAQCSTGIHVVTSLAQALQWGPVVVEMAVPETSQVVWGPDKVRVSEATVVSVVNLSGTNLSGAYLSRSDLSGADLSRVYLSGANLSGADLSRANLSGADLSGADLSRANLSRAYLSRADLSRVDLSRADLRGAYGIPISGAPDGWELKDGFWTKKEK